MIENPIKALRRTLLARGVPRRYLPQTRLAQLTAYFVVFALVFGAVALVGRLTGAKGLESFAGTWWTLLGDVSLVLLFFLLLRWIRQRFLWSLRRRLFVTYFFIGIIPIVLIVLMALIVGTLFAGQFGTYVAVDQMRHELDRMAAGGDILAAQMAERPGTTPEKRAQELLARVQPSEGAAISVWLDGRQLAAQPGSPKELPKWVTESQKIMAVDGDEIFLRTITLSGKLAVVSSLKFSPTVSQKLAQSLGTINVWLPNFEAKDQNWDLKPSGVTREPNQPRLSLRGGEKAEQKGGEKTVAGRSSAAVSAGALPEAKNRLDNSLVFGATYTMVDWKTGKHAEGLLGGVTRYSILYPQLFANMSTSAAVIVTLLSVAAIAFGIIELVAFFIGLRLSHSMTSSISNLYKATQHIKRADFAHRIEVNGTDQLSELQRSFNTMTEDIQRLIIEQKEKEKLQNELAIAQEVQDQLFPHNPKGLPTLEVHGVCKPARTVSGDYYDFVPFGMNKLGIAVGDISGKGISAALMMATVHSAVRAYEVLGNGALPALTRAATVPVPSDTAAVHLANATASPASALTLLNRHLYETTPLEKYATLFLGIYDETDRSLVYSNGGHLPPFLIGADGSVRKLEAAGGLMVGLFDHPKFEDAEIRLRPGDLFVAFSDGVIEPENEFGEFGNERLLEIIRPERGAPLAHISEQVIQAVQDWIGANEQPDDITLVLARAK